jgi:hypothetical protein
MLLWLPDYLVLLGAGMAGAGCVAGAGAGKGAC